MELEQVISLENLEKKGNAIFKKDNKQIAIFKVEKNIFALDNRCPHEGYPLSQGKHDGNCILTCNWHNWKFDMKNGKCITGGDNVKTYPIVIKDNEVFIDITEPTKEEIEEEILSGFKIAFEKRQYGRIARELSRLYFNKIDPLVALKKAIEWSYNKFEDGTTHAYAVTADWLKLYFENDNLEKRITYLTEAIDYISLESLRFEEFKFTNNKESWDEEKFYQAVENEDEEKAISLINEAFDKGLKFKDIEKALSTIALEHYNDFGHSLIYVQKTNYLIEHLGAEVEKYLVLPLVRSIIRATREDLLPEFKNYNNFLKQETKNNNENLEFWTKNVNDAMSLVINNYSEEKITFLYEKILLSNAKNMLHFDTFYQFDVENKVSENIGWLDFTHALTFSNAVREQCNKFPELWKKGLLQMACFSGRNKDYFTIGLEEKDYFVEDMEELKNNFFNNIEDHGIVLPIFPAHLLKTSIAVFDEVDNTKNEELKKYLLASINRFLHEPIKQKHVKRSIKQAIALVSIDFRA